ncbi:MAG: aminoacyl-tRNA hydrolase [Patescibacteria group bacterium]
MYYIAGLGNPGEKYKLSRHSTGRTIVGDFCKKNEMEDYEFNKKINALTTERKMGKEKIMCILPETFMNKSGLSLKPIITSEKKAGNLIVVHDDLDIPLGKFKISFGKNSGGHRGVESVIKNIKTKDFIRIRVGISPTTPFGKLKKPDAKKIIDHILGNFKPKELNILKKVSKKITSAIEIIIKEGLQKAMNLYN